MPVKEDTNRTFRTDSLFQGRVQEEMLIRLLEAFAWKSQCSGERSFTYVQGMNALAAPFLYVMPSQLEAFACFAALVERGIPQFVLGTNTEGAIRGAEVS
jgi:cell cycle arrest protein BUB2